MNERQEKLPAVYFLSFFFLYCVHKALLLILLWHVLLFQLRRTILKHLGWQALTWYILLPWRCCKDMRDQWLLCGRVDFVSEVRQKMAGRGIPGDIGARQQGRD